jgi:demethylmenaquinone methyltransferase/2-methoxy-6-polyprenyl-1,4-benzoquinol methylase
MGLLQRRGAARRWFELLAPGYDDAVSTVFWPEPLQAEAVDLLGVDAEDRVLDVGCGTGETTAHLLRRASDVHGVDLSARQLGAASEKDDLRGAQFVRADAGRLPYADDAFDRVASVGSILYWEDPVATLREVRRVTRPGGTVLVMGFNRRPFSPWDPVRNAQEAVNSALFLRYGPDEATRLFRAAGWADPEHSLTGPAWGPTLVVATTARNPADDR